MRVAARVASLALAGLFSVTSTSWAFCGFYVATSDEPLVNKASRVVLAHSENKTIVTMASDVAGDPKQFAVVIPVPTVINREQVKLVRSATVDHLAEFTKPRLVEYVDDDPCGGRPSADAIISSLRPSPGQSTRGIRPPETVHIEAQYSVGEYDIVVLSATDSAGLMTYLSENHYRVPDGAEPTIRSYMRQNMHFFLAKVDTTRLQNEAGGFLHPIQVEYSSPKFMLPIRLGTVNATGPQDMVVLALTAGGRVQTTNYRDARMPTDIDVPLFIEPQFGRFYDAVFDKQVTEKGSNAVFLEYAWNIGQMMCDPCSAEQMSAIELRELGANWLSSGGPSGRLGRGMVTWMASGPLFVTRLHVRYDRDHFPEDLQLEETPDTVNFQVRFVMRHPFTGAASCPAGRQYKATLPARFRQEAYSVTRLTGWSPASVADQMAGTPERLRN